MKELDLLISTIKKHATLTELEAYGINTAIRILEAKLTELENGKDSKEDTK